MGRSQAPLPIPRDPPPSLGLGPDFGGRLCPQARPWSFNSLHSGRCCGVPADRRISKNQIGRRARHAQDRFFILPNTETHIPYCMLALFTPLRHAIKPQFRPRGTGCVHCARPDQRGASSGLRSGGPVQDGSGRNRPKSGFQQPEQISSRLGRNLIAGGLDCDKHLRTHLNQQGDI